MPHPNRRVIVAGLAVLALSRNAHANAFPEMTVHKDPNCGCCGAWVDHVRSSGLRVNVIETRDMASVKKRLGVPDALASCHTAEVGAYILEGHVPAAEIVRMLSEKPRIRGLAVPGMPVNSPGMEVAGAPSDVYDVMQFTSNGEAKPYATYRGAGRI